VDLKRRHVNLVLADHDKEGEGSEE